MNPTSLTRSEFFQLPHQTSLSLHAGIYCYLSSTYSIRPELASPEVSVYQELHTIYGTDTTACPFCCASHPHTSLLVSSIQAQPIYILASQSSHKTAALTPCFFAGFQLLLGVDWE